MRTCNFYAQVKKIMQNQIWIICYCRRRTRTIQNMHCLSFRGNFITGLQTPYMHADRAAVSCLLPFYPNIKVVSALYVSLDLARWQVLMKFCQLYFAWRRTHRGGKSNICRYFSTAKSRANSNNNKKCLCVRERWQQLFLLVLLWFIHQVGASIRKIALWLLHVSCTSQSPKYARGFHNCINIKHALMWFPDLAVWF